jgi:uncharacterized ferritin-like protein (DUF455 family)
MGSFCGAPPAHDGLWDSAKDMAHDASVRLAIVPMELEARGLDVTLETVERFKQQGDDLAAKALGRIYRDEINHVFLEQNGSNLSGGDMVSHHMTIGISL